MVLLVDERPEEVTDMKRHVLRGDVVASTFDRPSDEHTQVAELTIERGEAHGRARQGRRDRARRHHPPRPRVQPLGAGVGPDPLRWRGLDRAVPAEEVLRRRPQHRRGRIADHRRDGPHRDRQPDGRGHLRGVQGHREHGAPPGPAPRRAPPLPGDRRQRELDPPRGAPVRAQPAQPGLEAPPGAERPRGRRRQRPGPRAPHRQAQDHQEQRRVPRRDRQGRRASDSTASFRGRSRRRPASGIFGPARPLDATLRRLDSS